MAYNIAELFANLIADRDKIRQKLVELGLTTSTAQLATLATVIAAITDHGAVSLTVKAGETVTIPEGYHNGTGTVSAVGDGGNYVLQAKSVTPTKSQQNITADDGYYGLSGVLVEAISDTYQDVSGVTATAADVLAGKKIITADGITRVGTIEVYEYESVTLTIESASYQVKTGYHKGCYISVLSSTVYVTPTKETQEITGDSGAFLQKVTVRAIPDAYQDVSEVTATAADVLAGKQFVDTAGNIVSGAIPIYQNAIITLDIDNPSYNVETGYHEECRIDVKTASATVTPSKLAQLIQGEDGAFLSEVFLEAIPDAYQDVSEVTATEDDVLAGKRIVKADGTNVEGTIANNGAIALTINGLTDTSVELPAGYTSGGTVTLTEDLEKALAAL